MEYAISCLKKEYDKCALLWAKASDEMDYSELQLNYKRMMQLNKAISILKKSE